MIGYRSVMYRSDLCYITFTGLFLDAKVFFEANARNRTEGKDLHFVLQFLKYKNYESSGNNFSSANTIKTFLQVVDHPNIITLLLLAILRVFK